MDVLNAIENTDFLKYEVQKIVANRGSEVISYCKTSSALSAANASSKTLNALHCGTKCGEWISIGVYNSGYYGIKPDIVYSFPVTVKNGVVTVVEGLQFDKETLSKMKLSEEELLHEKSIAFSK